MPVSWWVLAVLAVGALWLAYDAALGPGVALPAATLALLGVTAGLIGFGSLTVQVDEAGLGVGAARLPHAAVGAVEVLDAPALRDATGVAADRRAFHALRSYVRTGVRVWVDDPGDPVPAWVISTRHPQALAAALTAASRDQAG